MADFENQPVQGNSRELERIEQTLTKANPQLFKGVPEAKKNELLQIFLLTIQHTVTASHHVGPLPAPEQLAKYSESIPNGGDRIMAMAERQQEHRMTLENLAITEQLSQSRRGQMLGFVIGLAAIAGGVICILYGKEWPGTIIGGGGLTGLVSVFVIGKNKQNKSLESKNP